VTTAPQRPAPAPTLRERIVDAAVSLTLELGWARVTMAVVADRVGVSRQTVYNEVGTKPGLAEAMILHELDRFLGVVTLAFDQHPDDLVAAIRDASYDVLVLAKDNPLLHAVVSATHGADTELLPLLTTHSEALLGTVKVVVQDRVDQYEIDLGPERIAAVIDIVVRSALSHVMQPTASPRETAESITWLVACVLGRAEELAPTGV